MERFLFARVQVWVVLLLALIGLLGTMFFGTLVVDSFDTAGRFKAASHVARAVAEVPLTVKKLLEEDKSLKVYDSSLFDDLKTGWNFPKGKDAALGDGYLLLSRYDGTLARHVIELVDLRSFEVVHSWTLDADALLSDARRKTRFATFENWTKTRFRAIHPWMTENGDIIFKDHFSPLFRMNACAKRLWMVDDQIFHHSTESDGAGGLWVGSLVEPQTVERVADDFMEDEIAHVTTDGKVDFTRSITQLLLREGWGKLIFANDTYRFDPTHLNDIQPVLADGPYWKKGDVFISLRNISTILLYRPSTDQIIWSKTGPWESQHDVDVLDDHRISVYDNHAEDRGGNTYFSGYSDVLVYDFATDQVGSLLPGAFAAQKIRTATAGLSTVLPDGRVLIEDVTNARLILFAPNGDVLAEYANRGQDGRVYHLGWSRWYDRGYGDNALSEINKVNCDAK